VVTVSAVESQWLVRSPAPHLAPFIEQYVGYRLRGFAPGVHRGLPSRHVTFIVSIGGDIDVVAHTDPVQRPQQYRCVLSGLQASPAGIAHDGNQEGVAIELTPIGFRTLFRMPARALWNTSVELDDVSRRAGSELWERLQAVESWDERFSSCDDVLTRLVSEQVVGPELRHAWRLVVASGGGLSVADLADRVGWTRQHLTRCFHDEFGLSPKLAARVVRVERARRLLQAAPSSTSISQVAATCGYFDQAHLTRDFVALAGCSPGRLLVDDLPSFQDSDRLDPAPSTT
jgi:AraC-like DNA-binding protein